MDTIIAGTPQMGSESSDIYPDQTLTMYYLSTAGGAPGPWVSGKCASAAPRYKPTVAQRAPVDSATNSIEGPRWSRNHFGENTGKLFSGRSVGDFRMTGSDELVNIPGHYVTPAELARVKQCDMRQTARERGIGWQSANISSECNGASPFQGCSATTR